MYCNILRRVIMTKLNEQEAKALIYKHDMFLANRNYIPLSDINVSVLKMFILWLYAEEGKSIND